MKTTNRFLSVLLCALILLSVFTCVPISVGAATTNAFEVDGILYRKTSDYYGISIQVVGYNKESGLTDVVIPSQIYDYPVTEIYESAFRPEEGETSTIKSVYIPSSVNKIGAGAFSNCTELSSVVMEEGVEIINEAAFAGCSSLEYIDIPESVRYIYYRVFARCTSLKSIKLPSNHAGVYEGLFYNCTSLETVYLPDDTYTIGEEAFRDCVNLKNVYFEDGTEIREISRKAFYNCESLEEIDLPYVGMIYESAFENCYRLKKVDIKEGLKAINKRAFYNCVSLNDFFIPESVNTIDSYALACFDYDNNIYVNGNFTVRGSKDSLADEFADAYGVKWGLPAPILKSVSNVKAGVKVSFKQVAGVTGKYRVYRKTAGSSWKKLADVTGSSYTDETAKAGVKYTYTVKLITSKQTSTYDSKGLSIIRLSTPEISKITSVNDGMKISWNKSSGASSYIVYVKNSDDWEEIGTTSSTSITFSGFSYRPLVPGKTYKFTIKAVDSTGKYKSGCITAGWKHQYIAPPQITKTSNTETGVKITWGKVEGAENYRVFVKSGSSWKKLKDTTSTSFTHTGVESGKTYTYTVRCISSTGKSYKSGYDTVGTKAMFLSTPAVTKISNTVDGVKLTYKESIGASKYNIYANSGSGFKKIGESTTTTFVHENAKSGTSYTYRVRAYDSTGDFSSYYKTSSKNTFIAAPVIKELESTSKGVNITWDKVTGAAKYRVFVKSGSSWKKLKDTTATTFTHTGVESGKEYTYTVRCISSTGKSYTSGYDTIGSSVLFEK